MKHFAHPKLLTPPATELVELDDLKKHLRVPFSDDDTYLNALIVAARNHIEGWQGWVGRCFLDQVWSQKFDCWHNEVKAPFPDLIAAVVKYLDVNGDSQTVLSSNYFVTDERIWFKSSFTFPTLLDEHPEPITVEWQHGVSTLPDDVKLATMMLIAHWYENREAIVPNERRVELNVTPIAFRAIMAQYNTGYAV